MYNCVDSCCLFDIYRQLIQHVVYLDVYMIFNGSLDTRNYNDLCALDGCSYFVVARENTITSNDRNVI
jgi:hypothetical protein